MDPNFNIYMDEDVPGEDKARLEGYLKAKAEQDRDAHAEYLAEMEAKVREMQEARERAVESLDE